MEKSETVVEENGNGRISWINHGLVKAFVAGFVIATGASIAGLLNWILKMPDWPTINGFPISFVFHIFFLIMSIYLTLQWVNNLLKRFGFEGVMVHQNEKLNSPKLFSAASGCLLVQLSMTIVGVIGVLIYVGIGEAKFKLLIAAVIVAVIAFFVLARRVSHNQSKTQ